MLELMDKGRMCSGIEAVEFFELLPDMLDPDQITEDFSEQYEAALNRLRWLVQRDQGLDPEVIKMKYHRYSNAYYCRSCKAKLDVTTDRYCRACGRAIHWDYSISQKQPTFTD